MEPPVDILLFGDQTGDYPVVFRNILHVKDDVFLKAFFERTTLALRDELSHQPSYIQKQIPTFSSIIDLVTRYAEPHNSRSNALESALTCISQLACFFSYQSQSTEGYPVVSQTRAVGSCTGLLAAAAVGSCCSLADLLDVAVDTVRIAFRLGAVVAETATEIERDTSPSSSWSVIVPNLKPEQAKELLDALHEKNSVPPCSFAYISATSANGITISGPHHILDQLIQSSDFQNFKSVRLPIAGPYHAPHLFNDIDVNQFFNSISTNTLDNHALRIPVSSTSDLNWRSTETLRQTLDLVIRDILVNPLRWDLVIENVASLVSDRGDYHCNVIQLGPSNAKKSLVSALKAKDLEVLTDDRFVHGSETADSGSGHKSQPKIAICGLSGRFPESADHEAFWKLLEQGLDLHREVPNDRFNVKTHVDTDGKRANTTNTPYGCFILEPGMFDTRFFNMSPREAAQTDPMQRLALVTAYEALEMSGFVENRTPSTKLNRVGTFYGQTSDDWRMTNASQKVDTYFIPGGIRAFGPGRINYFFKFSGPSYSIDTACSSSLASIQMACTSLWAGECDTALAGGMNILTSPDMYSGLSRGQFLSKKGPCATFDNEADGYCRGEAVGSVVMKRLEDAEADGDPILGVILGAATNHSAEAISITHPHAGAQEFLYKTVMNNAGIDPHDISYVEMHGTGTQAGDAIEMESVLGAFDPPHRRRDKDHDVYLGAVKANAGHGEAASGVTALIKVMMMLEKSTIPPHCGIKGTINRTFPKDMEERNVHIAFKPTPWKRPDGGKRRLFLNNFSAAGGNTSLILEEGDVRSPLSGTDDRSYHVVTVTAKSQSSLKSNALALVDHMEKSPDLSLPSLSYTTTARRMQHTFRISVSGADLGAMKDALKKAADKEVQMIPKTQPKVTLMFTGQGSHYTSMAKQLYEISSQFRSDILKFDKSAKMQGFDSFLPLIDGSESDLDKLPPLVVQLGATCVQMALFRLYKSWGIEPTVVVGHSLGEYAALNAAGVLSATDAIYLCGTRAKLLQEKCKAGTHSMLAVKASVASIGEHLKQTDCEVACINTPEQTVLSGAKDSIETLASNLKDAGFKADKLPIPFAFHSAQVDPILEEFEAKGRGVSFNKPAIPVISPLLNNVVIEQHDPTFSATYMRDHCRKTVNFLGGIEAAKHAGLIDEGTVWLEIGAHPLCTGMVKATLGPKIKSATSLRRKEDNWKMITGSMCSLNDFGLKLDWNQYHNGFDSSHELVKLPSYQWDNKNYWIEYKNDWTLYKGDHDLEAEVPKAPPFSSASVHRIAEVDLDAEKPRIVGECDLTETNLREVLDGHEVNGFGLCPPSLYCDMAYTVAKHLYALINPENPDTGLNVVDIKVEKPLVVAEKGPQMFQLAGTYDKSSQHVGFEFFTVNAEGKRLTLHATGGVKYEDPSEWQTMWNRHAYLVKSQIDRLIKGVDDSDFDFIKRGMAYKLFGGLITYGYKYRGMEEAILDSDGLEGTSRVKFQTGGSDDGFNLSPYRTDSVAHLSGFTMVGNRYAENTKEVFVSQGWENYRVAKPLECGKEYRSYVKMQKEGASAVRGDLYVLEGEEVVAVMEGLRFHKMPRGLMDSFLAAAAGKPQAKPKPAAAPAPKSTQPAPAQPKPEEPAAPAPTKQKTGGITSKALQIIADEVGIPVSDLSDESSFSDLGVDSLLALNISSNFRESFNLDVQSTVFVDYPTVKAMKGFLAEQDGGSAEPAAPEPSPVQPSEGSSDRSTSPATDKSEGSPAPSSATSISEGDSSPTRGAKDATTGDPKLSKTIRKTIADELGIELSEISDSSDLASLGMDSLMSLSVLGKLKETTGQDLPNDFFANNSTMKEVESAMGVSQPSASTVTSAEQAEVNANVETQQSEKSETVQDGREAPRTEKNIQPSTDAEDRLPGDQTPAKDNLPSHESKEQHTTSAKPPDDSTDANTHEPRPSSPKPTTNTPSSPPPAASSILLQGPSPPSSSSLPTDTRTPTLFLFPDGSGSPTTYATLPRLRATTDDNPLTVYALASPYLPSSSSNTSHSSSQIPPFTIPSLATSYINELKRRQPHGPYNLAGWSAGGLCAYEAVSQLLAAGDRVAKLLLIDTPSMRDLGRLPGGLHEWFGDVGVSDPNAGKGGGKDAKGEGKVMSRRRKEGMLELIRRMVEALGGYEPGRLVNVTPPSSTTTSSSSTENDKPAEGKEEKRSTKKDIDLEVHFLWARNGILTLLPASTSPPPPEERDGDGKALVLPAAEWLLRDRAGDQLEDGGWEEFIGAEACKTGDGEGEEKECWRSSVVDGAHHFSLMQREGEGKGKVEEVGRWLSGRF